jgi:hypothetical protein
MRLAPVAVVCLLAATAGAYPDKSPIRRAIRAEMGRFRACYERALVKDPKLEGKVVAKFTIDAKGNVADATAEGMPPIDACIAGVIKTIKFPAYGSTMVVSYPFAFAPR